MAARRSGPPQLAPSFFDALTGGEMEPAHALPLIIGDIVSTAGWDADWVIESAGNRPVRLGATEQGRDRSVIAFTSDGIDGVAILSGDESGWVIVSVEIDGREYFRAYLDQPWEEYELLPPGARRRRPSDDIEDDTPGRMGKRRNWINLDVRQWPELEPLANRFGYVLIEPASASPRAASPAA